MTEKTQKLVLSIANVLVLCAVIIAVSFFFIYDSKWMGYVLIGLSIPCLISIKLFNISLRSVKPDIVFGVIDNGILAAFAVLGGELAGVAGAIAGGVVGNAVTDGVAGLFEGYAAERAENDRRTIVGSAVGKMAGCLLGAGAVLVMAGAAGF